MAAAVLVEVDGALGRIRLNRPEALNSLTLEMVRRIDAAIDRLLAAPEVKVIALTGEGSKGLCAGGDIKMFWQMGRQAPEAPLTFWEEEYRLNSRIQKLSKPWLAVMDGICMGGGVGLSVHGRYRLVTERTRFAMPETGIGYFPDVGASFVLPRVPDHLGYYIGLTGASLTGADVLAAGLAESMIPSSAIETLLADLASGLEPAAAIAKHRVRPDASELDANRALIARAFAGPDMAAIVSALEAEGTEFARGALAHLRRQSPSSLVLTLALLQRGAELADLQSCLAMELAADRLILTFEDFYEGIRAAVIDKDRTPNWQPARLELVDSEALLARLSAALAPEG